MDQGRLPFDESRYELPAQQHSETSRFAAKAAKSGANRNRFRILAHLSQFGEYGATDQEMQVSLRINGNSERPRRRELEQAGLVIASEKRRSTKYHRPATVWTITDRGLAFVVKPVKPAITDVAVQTLTAEINRLKAERAAAKAAEAEAA